MCLCMTALTPLAPNLWTRLLFVTSEMQHGRIYRQEIGNGKSHCQNSNPLSVSYIEQLSMDDAEDATCMTFVFKGEDHTLGNALRYAIMKK